MHYFSLRLATHMHYFARILLPSGEYHRNLIMWLKLNYVDKANKNWLPRQLSLSNRKTIIFQIDYLQS